MADQLTVGRAGTTVTTGGSGAYDPVPLPPLVYVGIGIALVELGTHFLEQGLDRMFSPKREAPTAVVTTTGGDDPGLSDTA